MDTAGKDGAIKHVMSGVINPQGREVVSFKQRCAEMQCAASSALENRNLAMGYACHYRYERQWRE
jgi:hypothetical protein